jgi:uncharacterized membrane protein
MKALKKIYELRPTLDKARHMVKSLSYRIYSSCITTAIATFVTGNSKLALAIGSTDFLIKLFTYYIHERVWFYIPFGLQRPRKIHSEINWAPSKDSYTQAAFIQSEQGEMRKRAKILHDGSGNYRALLSSHNSRTKERFNDIITGTKEEIENTLKIKL